MSLFRKIGKIVGKVAKVASGFIPGPIGAVARVATKASAIGGAAMGGRALIRGGSRGLPALPMPRSLPGIGAVGRGGLIKTAAGTAAGVAIYDAAGNFIGNKRKSRRINPLNNRALMRALRRIEKAKKVTKRLAAITIRKGKDC